MNEAPRTFSFRQLEQWVGPLAFRPGAACFQRGGVTPPDISHPRPGAVRISGFVQDEALERFQVQLEWDGNSFRARCDCEVGTRCLHVGALGLAFLDGPKPASPARPEPGASPPSLAGGLQPGQEVLLYGLQAAPPPRKLQHLYRRPQCLWLSLDVARLDEALEPGRARPLGLWSMPPQPFREADREILARLLPFHRRHGRDFSAPHARGIPLLEEDVDPVLRLLEGYPHVYGAARSPLTIVTERSVVFRRLSTWTQDEGVWELDGVALPLSASRLVGDSPAWVQLDATLFPVRDAGQDEAPEGDAPDLEDPALQRVVHPEVAPVPRLTLQEDGETLVVRLSFLYGDALPVLPADPRPIVAGRHEGVWGFWHRLADAERACLRRVAATSLDPRGDGEWVASGPGALDFLLDDLPSLISEGWQAFGEERLSRLRVDRRRSQVSVRVVSGVDWFDLETVVTLEGQALDGQLLLAAMRSGSRFVRLDTGGHVRLPEAWIARQQDWLGAVGRPEAVAGGVQQRLERHQALALQDLFETVDRVETDAAWQELVERLLEPQEVPEQVVPPGFVGELRPYQQRGFEMLCFWRDQGFNGILADDMGLGKSIQAITLILRERAAGAPGPTLLVAPTSVVYNWEREFARFAPDLRIRVHHGSDRHLDRQVADEVDVIVTSYALLRRDQDKLGRIPFHLAILDEAQNIKNARSLGAQAARGLRARHRLCLTGTPIENNLLELWSLFHFLMPGYLGTERSFRDRFMKLTEVDALGPLRRLTRPFILRRLKADVAQDLPPRTDMVRYCEFEPDQRAFYDGLLAGVRREVLGAVESKGFARARFNVLEGLLRLRQACCDPALVRPGEERLSSAKVEEALELIRELHSEGHRVLVFSQFVKVLKILGTALEAEDIAYSYLDGHTRDRIERVQAFNEGNTPVFLISLKAGGTGLNLTGADHVILFDPWWNPAVEEQAIDRAHRIGQTRHVFSTKLIARGTIEEKVLALQERKRLLAKDILSVEALGPTLSREDLEFLFS